MKTQVIKFNTLRDNVSGYLKKLAQKVGINKNFDITLIVKHNQNTQTDQVQNLTGKSILTNSSILNKGFVCQQQKSTTRFKNSTNNSENVLAQKIDLNAYNEDNEVQNIIGSEKQNIDEGRHNSKIPSISINYKFNKKNQCKQQSVFKQEMKKTQEQEEEDNQDDDLRHISRTNIDIFPNIQFQSVSSLKSVARRRESISNAQSQKKTKSGKNISLSSGLGSHKSSFKLIAQSKQKQDKGQIQRQKEQSSMSSKKVVRSSKSSFSSNKDMGNSYVIKVNDEDMIQQQADNIEEDDQEQDEDQDQDQESMNDIFIVQNKLNDAMKFLQKNQLTNLEDFLYDFKDKYIYMINTRVQIKWRLLMAHCKQNRKQYERAAINYNQVIQISKQHPKSLTINPADVHHRLGICYSEINEYNKGIVSFMQALNGYKSQKNNMKYAQCLNNLGSLYLVSNSIAEAQKCFLMSYKIKKSLYGNRSNNLLTSLFNMFQCNLVVKNFDQAANLLQMMENIIQQIKDNGLYLGGLYRRRGKLSFLRGNLKSTQQNYTKSQKQLNVKYPYCMEYGQLLGNMGLLKIQQIKYHEAKQCFQKALMLLNFYYCKESSVISTIKKNIQFAQNLIQQSKQASQTRKPSFNLAGKLPLVSFAL